MTDTLVRDEPATTEGAPVLSRLSVLDRFLPAWILVAMGLGLGLGRGVTGLSHALDSAHVTAGVPAPIFIGLLAMMYPVLAKVRYRKLGEVTGDTRLL
ncbi:MAG: arsenical-resistance protein, partial [Acidimicrobiales bacterium]